MRINTNIDNYEEIRGVLKAKQKKLLSRYFFEISNDAKSVKIIVSKNIYNHYSVGDKLTIGYINRELVNIRPGICKNESGG